MEILTNRLRCCMLLLLLMASVLVGVCQMPKTGFTAGATSLNFYINDNPSVYAYTGETRTVTATVQISLVLEGTFIPGVHTPPSWTVTISGPNPTNPQQTVTVATETFTYPGYPYDPPIHPGAYTTTNVSITLPAAAGAYTYTASLTGGEGTPEPVQDSAYIVEVASLEYKIGTGDFAAVPGMLYVAKGTEVTFKAIPNPSGVWPSGKPFWTWAIENNPPDTATVTFDTEGFFTVFAECGNAVSSDIGVYTVAIVDFPVICAGAKNDSLHQGQIRALASVDGTGIEGTTIVFTLGNLTGYTTLDPTLLSSSANTNENGIAEITLRSGKGILDGNSANSQPVTITPSVNGVSYENMSVAIDSPNMDVTFTDPDSDEEISTIITHGGIININTILEFNDSAVSGHNISVYFKFFASFPDDPYTAEALFVGVISQEDQEDECDPKHTMYGKLSSGSGTTDGEGKFTISYTSGSQEGYVYFFVYDNDTYRYEQ